MYQGFVHNYRPTFYKLFGHVQTDELYSKEWYSFKVVRNPYTRAVSSYFHVMRTLLVFNYFVHSTKEIDNRLQKEASFKEFYDYYYRYYIIEKKKNYVGGDHTYPQSREWEMEFYKKFNNSIFNDIVKLEKFQHDIAIVNNKTKQHFHTGLYKDNHVAEHKDYKNITFVGNYPYTMFFSSNNKGRNLIIPSNYSLFYDSYLTDLISTIYVSDFELYNY